MAALLLCASAASCSQDDMTDQGKQLPDGKYPLSLTATVGTPQTRAGGMDKWQGGEEIAVSIGDYIGKYTMDANGNATSGTPYYWQNTAKATVCAWYPYAEGLQTYDISDQSQGYAAFDFLYAETEGSYAAPVQLTFYHQMAKVSYTLEKGDGITDEGWEGATVRIAGYTKASFSEGKLTGTDDGWITPTADCEALLVPQNMTGKPFIKVGISGNNFIYTPDTEAAGNLKAGCQHFYTITVKANGIEVTAASDGEWTKGGSEDVKSKGVQNRYAASDLKPGDFFYSDGNWSDGGLRTIYTDGTYRIDAAAVPDPNKTCIGIVFYAGRHGQDASNYSEPTVIHGYAVALTDVHNDDSDRLRWEWGPNGKYDQLVNTAHTSSDDWNGYFNNLKFHRFVSENSGWDMKHLPAALACKTYGNRTLNQNGNQTSAYEWQEPLAAPSKTSGWFLPSCGQLKYLYQNRSLLSNRMTDVKNRTSPDCDYKDKIKWFNESWFYWSSAEDWNFSDVAWYVDFHSGYGFSDYKNYTGAVRAVLVF